MWPGVAPQHDLGKRKDRTLIVPLMLSVVHCETILTKLESFQQPCSVSNRPLHHSHLDSKHDTIVRAMPSTALFACSTLPFDPFEAVRVTCCLAHGSPSHVSRDQFEYRWLTIALCDQPWLTQ